MSKVNFENAPPAGGKEFDKGDWVQCLQTRAFGVVEGTILAPASERGQHLVRWASGETHAQTADNLAESAPTMFYQSIVDYAGKEFQMSTADVLLKRDILAAGRDPMSFEVLCALEADLLHGCNPDPDENYEGTWETIEKAAVELIEDEDIFAAFEEEPVSTDAVFEASAGFFIAFVEEGEVIWGIGRSPNECLEDARKSFKEHYKRLPQDELAMLPATECLFERVGVRGGDPCWGNWDGAGWTQRDGVAVFVPAEERVTTGPHEYHEGSFAAFIDGDSVEEFDTHEGACESIPDWIRTLKDDPHPIRRPSQEEPAQKLELDPKRCYHCQETKINKSSPTWRTPLIDQVVPVCKKCLIILQNPPAEEPQTASDADSSSSDTGEDSAPGNTAENAADATIGERDPKPVDTAAAESPGTGSETATSSVEGVRTDAGLIDPETGELLDQSLIMRKFGWSSMPELSAKPTKEELDAFQEKIDQVVDRILTNRDIAARWRAQNEIRCKPLEGSADFWDENFVKPMAKQLGKHRMPKRGKTLHLRSGSIQYTQAGGAFVHDADLVKKHIEEKGLAPFAAIDAKQVISYNYQKLLSALNNGSLKDIPGTGVKAKDPIAKVTVVSPKATEPKKEEANDPDQE